MEYLIEIAYVLLSIVLVAIFILILYFRLRYGRGGINRTHQSKKIKDS